MVAGGALSPSAYPNPTNNLEWDNLPAQRCYWYQVQKVQAPYLILTYRWPTYRSMVVYVNQGSPVEDAAYRGRHAVRDSTRP